MPGHQFDPGGGGGSISGLTPNRIVKATAADAIGNSLLSDDATNVTVTSGKLLIGSGSPGIANSTNVNTGITIGSNTQIIRNGSVQAVFDTQLIYLNNGLKLPGATKTTTFGMSQQDAFLFADATSGGFTITLPAASSATNGTVGQFFIIQKIDSSVNAVTIARAGADTINGAASKTLTTQYQGILIFGTGATTWGATTLVAA